MTVTQFRKAPPHCVLFVSILMVNKKTLVNVTGFCHIEEIVSDVVAPLGGVSRRLLKLDQF